MSLSPRQHLRPISTNLSSPARESVRREEDLINAFEADQERITLTLSRKLEQLRSEKIQLENTLEAEGESQVLRLSRQLSVLRLAQQQQQQQQQTIQNAGGTSSQNNGHDPGSRPETAHPSTPQPIQAPDPRYPSTDAILEALRRENDSLRKRLTDTERDFVRVTRMNDIYREELIEHRRRLGLSVDNLIGLSGASVTNSPAESLSQPTHRRTHTSVFVNMSSTSSVASSPEFAQILPNRATGATPIPIHPQQATSTTSIITPVAIGLPIPRSSNGQTSHSQRRVPVVLSTTTTSSSSSATSPSSSLPPSPFTFSPSNSQVNDLDPESSYNTQATTPPSSTSPPMPLQPFAFQPLQQQLSYPSVPPPSLSSSLGSPVVSLSPTISRRNSVGQANGNGPGGGGGNTAVHRRVSVERGARIAETGTLLGRGRRTRGRIGE